MSDWDLADKGFSYDVVAVFGSQSTGKSALDSGVGSSNRADRCVYSSRAGTLLNRLFGTKFDVMNENERRQTTKGA